MSPSLVSGLVGGFLATAVAGVVFVSAGRDRPTPAARLWARYVDVDGPQSDGVWPGAVVQTVSGILAGGVFALILTAMAGTSGDVGFLPVVAWGVGYGLVLFTVHVGGILHVALGLPIDPERLAEYFVLHVIYGTVLGAWTGLDVLVAAGAT
jgi:hypothetical protein